MYQPSISILVYTSKNRVTLLVVSAGSGLVRRQLHPECRAQSTGPRLQTELPSSSRFFIQGKKSLGLEMQQTFMLFISVLGLIYFS